MKFGKVHCHHAQQSSPPSSTPPPPPTPQLISIFLISAMLTPVNQLYCFSSKQSGYMTGIPTFGFHLHSYNQPYSWRVKAISKITRGLRHVNQKGKFLEHGWAIGVDGLSSALPLWNVSVCPTHPEIRCPKSPSISSDGQNSVRWACPWCSAAALWPRHQAVISLPYQHGVHKFASPWVHGGVPAHLQHPNTAAVSGSDGWVGEWVD